MKTTQGFTSNNGFKNWATKVRRVATAPMSARQIRRVVLVGSLAVPLSGALLWSSISPVSASSSVHSSSQASALVTQTVKVDHSTTGITLRRGSAVTDNASVTAKVTAKVTSKVATTASAALATSKKLVPTKVPTRPVTRATAPVARISNPQANIAPSPNFLQAGQCSQLNGAWTCANPCVTPQLSYPVSDNSPACTSYLLLAINNARAIEGLVPMSLPSNWYSLSVPQQLFVVADMERTARGLPPYLGINAALTAQSQSAAQTDADPGVANGFAVSTDPGGYPAMGGAWSAGFNVLAADYMWMYDDGWGGSAAATSNIACTSASAAGCWAHRDELLGSDPGFNPGVGLASTNCEMGVGYAVVGGSGSYVDLIERPAGNAPAMTFTWAQEVASGL